MSRHARVIYPWTDSYPCDECGCGFRATRANTWHVAAGERVLCEGCEMYGKGYADGEGLGAARVAELETAMKELIEAMHRHSQMGWPYRSDPAYVAARKLVGLPIRATTLNQPGSQEKDGGSR